MNKKAASQSGLTSLVLRLLRQVLFVLKRRDQVKTNLRRLERYYKSPDIGRHWR
jgi:hypothetical protein